MIQALHFHLLVVKFTAGETSNNHPLRLTTAVNDQTMMLGYDNSVDIGYINCAKSGSFQPLCLQTRGANVGIGLTNPSERLDVDATIKCANLKTANHTDVDGTLTTLNSSVATNTSNISTNTSNISTNTSNISTNTGNISTNTGNISTNASNISTNTSNISTNTSNISTNTSNISTNTTKLTGISFDSGTSKTTISNILTSNDIEIRESNINFNRNDGSSACILQYQSEGLTIKEARGGNATEFKVGGDNVEFTTGASGSANKFTVTSDATPTINLGTDSGTRGAIMKMEGVDGDSGLDNCVFENRLFNGTDESELVIFKGNDHLGTNTDRIRLRSGQIAFDVFASPTSTRTTENIRATIDSDSIDTNVQMVITKAGDDNDSETNTNHCLRLTSGTNNRTMFMGVDDTDELGYINCAQNLATKPIAIQTRGSNLAVGGTTANFRLDVDGDGRTTQNFTCNSLIETSSKKIKNVESSLNDESTNQEALNLFNSIPLSKYTHIDKKMNNDFVHYGLIAEDMPNNIYRFDSDGYIPCIYQYGDIVKEDDKYKITFNEKLDLSKIQNEESNNIKCYSIKDNKYDTDIVYIFKNFEIIDENTIKGVFKGEFTENKIFVYGVEGIIPTLNKNAYFELTSCVVKHLVKENNELKERLNKIEEILNIN